jgi:transposase
VAASLERRTRRVAELARLVGHTSGGRPAERLSNRLGLPQSDDTVLRNLKRHAGSSSQNGIRVVGVDDWAWQRGCRYGTIMVDLERREVVDVLPDRSAKTTGEWLAQHPGIEIVSRDRCGLYAEGARQGAPQARQVADRFHLLQNLRQTIEQQLSRAPRPARPPSPETAEAGVLSAAEWTGHGRQPALVEHRNAVSAGRGARLADKFNRLKALQASGATASAIVRQTGFHGRTVKKWMQVEELPSRSVMAPKPSTPVRFQSHLAERWLGGCTSGRTLLLEIKGLGYTGSLSQLNRLLTEWRRTGRPTAAAAEATTSQLVDPATGHLVSPIVAAALCVKPRGMLTPTQAVTVDAFKASSAEFAAMRALAMRFRSLLRGGDVESLTIWLHDAQRSTFYGIRRFAQTLTLDLAAVRNAITERWSNGQVESQINRLKMLKRAMFGRAGVDLLRARMMPLSLRLDHPV